MAETIEELKKKTCVDCLINKPYSEYHKKTKSGKEKVQSRCIPCMSVYKKKRYWANRDTELVKMTKSRLKPENVAQRKGYYKKNKEAYKKRYYKYMSDEQKRERKRLVGVKYEREKASKIRERKRAYNQREDVKIRRRKLHYQRKETDVQYNIKRRLRFRLRHIIKALGDDKYKWMSSLVLIGCSMEEFKNYIESLFKDGMCWDRLSEIHIDHIKPCSKFDLTKLEEQKKCFHYTNLQPLWSIDNLKKSSKYEEVYV